MDPYEAEEYGTAMPVAAPGALEDPFQGVVGRPPIAANSTLFYLGMPAKVADVDREPDTVTLRGNFEVSQAELEDQLDGGAALELRLGDGIDEIEFSNPNHSLENMAKLPQGVNVLKGRLRATQENSLAIPLVMGVNVPAPSTFTKNGSDVKEAHAPNGYLTFTVPHKGAVEIERTLSPETRQYLADYPGQTAESQDRMVFATPTDPTTALIQVRGPRSYALNFYNNHPEIVKSGKALSAEHGDVRGRTYGDAKIAAEAVEKSKAAIRKNVTFCNLFTKDFVVSCRPVDKSERVKGAPVRIAGSLAKVQAAKIEEMPGIKALKATNPRKVEEVKKSVKFSVNYSITLPYITTSPDYA